MDPQTVDAGRRQQAQLYGEPLGDLGRRLMSAFGITQGRLAEVLGLSAPMLSQLMSGQRVKIGNPAVVGRLQALLDLADRAASAEGGSVAAELDRIRASSSPLTGPAAVAQDDRVLSALARVEPPDQLAAAADVLRERWPRLAEVLDRAARSSSGERRG